MNHEPHSRVLLGCERTQVVSEHLRWLNGRAPSQALRELDHNPREGDAPIAIWSRGNRLAQARRRSRIGWGSGSNRKRFDRADDAPPLIDEVT